MKNKLEYIQGKLVYIDRYRTNIINEYNKMFEDIIIKKRGLEKEEMRRIKKKIENDYEYIKNEYGYIFKEIENKILQIYKICYQNEKREKEIEKMVKEMIHQVVLQHVKTHNVKEDSVKCIKKKVRFNIERK